MNTNYHDTVITTYSDPTRMRFVGEVHRFNSEGDQP